MSQTLRGAIADENNELWLSPISIWETLILAEKGKIILKPELAFMKSAIIGQLPYIFGEKIKGKD